ncbi:carboxypeptidase Y inhibitor [Coniosporium apollinis]|uniref:Carboxypeptidase Y inhibitor n=2 Tax=Coniosporium TaxID=2810619 RepID=A0ABQ9P3Y6_9PEZI|nr:carboxypeptidase Y inhibitor [Cladosporium sp. JES 115]KAJ9669314.1 carboxypeptidase Y inhibitor [Coniosporium apollinis]
MFFSAVKSQPPARILPRLVQPSEAVFVDDFLPSLTLKVSWPSHKKAELGNTIKPDDVQDIPSLELHNEPTSSTSSAVSNMTYTVALTDPDAPSRDNPEWSEICHWIATGVPLSSESAANPADMEAATQTAAKGLKEVMEYKPPGPPPKTGKHRYVFLAFAPANGTSRELHLSKPKDRQHWGYEGERMGVRKWAEENGLVPVAANFIYSQNAKQ